MTQIEIEFTKTLDDFPQDIYNRLIKERETLKEKWQCNDYKHICLVNNDSTLYFEAMRWNDIEHGKCWTIRYGKIKVGFLKKSENEYDPEWTKMHTFRTIIKNGVQMTIPRKLNTKKEVIDLVKKIGKFSI